MKLDRHTYEAWLLDRIEGRLTPAQVRELEGFLAANPDLDAVPGDLPNIADTDTGTIDWKNELKKSFPPVGDPDRARLDDFLVARVEKELGPGQEAALDRFLYEHPEFAQEARRMAVSVVHREDPPFVAKGSIERRFPPQGQPDKHRLSDFLIAAGEGDLTDAQRAQLSAYLEQHPEARREERLIAASRVRAEELVFPDKRSLKHEPTRVIPLFPSGSPGWGRYALAASIALLIGFAWWVNTGEGTGTNLAVTTQPSPSMHIEPAVQDPVMPVDTVASPAPQERARPAGAHESADEGVQEPAHGPRRKERTAPVPAPEPAPLERNRHDPDPGTQLAQEAVTPDQEEVAPPNEPPTPVAWNVTPGPAMAAVGRPVAGGAPIATVLANTVRHKVIDTTERDATLDGGDALAMVNKGLGAITGGRGAVDVERTRTRDRWKLRLGRNLAISASTGR